MTAVYQETLGDTVMICPYCGNEYEPEAEDYSEDCEVEECGDCGKKYHAYQSISVTHHATPDCELNGEQHNWKTFNFSDGSECDFCATCDKCRPPEW